MAGENEIVMSPLREADGIEETLAYWTPEAMAAAVPIFMEIDEDEDGKPDALFEQSPAAEETMASVAPDEDAIMAIDPPPTVPDSGSNTRQVSNRRALPYAAVGKLYMTFDNANYVGSAWTIAKSGVFTAGHCVFNAELGGWADRLTFIPQYQDGTEPLGRWTFTQAASLQGWTSNRDFRFDLGAFKTDRPIQPVTGSPGWMANHPANQGAFTGIGYPAAPHPRHAFNGQRMWSSTGKYRGGSNPIQMWNDMTGGCSGGPWTIWRNNDVFANGLNSFRYRNDPDSLYSPHFGDGFLGLHNWVK